MIVYLLSFILRKAVDFRSKHLLQAINRAALIVPREHIMEHFAISPMHQLDRRTVRASAKHCPATEKDTRWHLLDLVRTCRQRLTLRDRDIAVLRGLLSLLPASATSDQLVVFASNRVLIERCDGIDERTLRRRISHLQSRGLLHRRTSPNGKRYQVRDDVAARITYGLDLAPLFEIETHLEALADECRREAQRIKALRSLIRDALFKRAASVCPNQLEAVQRALRRVLASDQLQKMLEQIKQIPPDEPAHLSKTGYPLTSKMSASDGQYDRHIQSSNKELFESETVAVITEENCTENFVGKTSQLDKADITVSECIDLAPTARSMAITRPQCWDDLIALSDSLAPAIGVKKPLQHDAQRHLGRHGYALAVLGLVESYGRIRNPEAYLNALIKRAVSQSLDLVRMFRSLVKPVPATST